MSPPTPALPRRGGVQADVAGPTVVVRLKEAARLVDEELRDSTELIRNARNQAHRHPVGAAGAIR